MADPVVIAALRAAFTDESNGPPRPTTIAGARSYFDSGAALARAMIETGPAPAGGWPKPSSVARAVQRAIATAPRETRSSRKYLPAALEVAEGPWRKAVEAANLELARENGLEVRIIVTRFKISKTERGRTVMPSQSAGIARWVHIAPDEAEPVIAAWEAGDEDQAAGELLAAFLRSWPFEGAELGPLESGDVRVAA